MSQGAHRLPQSSKKLLQILSMVRASMVSSLLGANLAALALIRRPSEAMAYIQYGLFGWRMISGQGLPQRQLHSLFATPQNVSINLLPTTSYLTWWDANYAKDVVYLALMAKVLSPKTVFEIGTFNGYTALLFAQNTAPNTSIYTLDLPPDGSATPTLSSTLIDDHHAAVATKSTDYLYVSHPEGQKVNQIYADSAQFDFTPYHGQVDMFFIDGAHSYEYVRSDTLKALPCVRSGGVIVWHDYGRWGVNGVSRWLHELARSGRDVCRLPGSSLAILKV